MFASLAPSKTEWREPSPVGVHVQVLRGSDKIAEWIDPEKIRDCYTTNVRKTTVVDLTTTFDGFRSIRIEATPTNALSKCERDAIERRVYESAMAPGRHFLVAIAIRPLVDPDQP